MQDRRIVTGTDKDCPWSEKGLAKVGNNSENMGSDPFRAAVTRSEEETGKGFTVLYMEPFSTKYPDLRFAYLAELTPTRKKN